MKHLLLKSASAYLRDRHDNLCFRLKEELIMTLVIIKEQFWKEKWKTTADLNPQHDSIKAEAQLRQLREGTQSPMGWGKGFPGDSGWGGIIVTFLFTEKSLLNSSNIILRRYYLLCKLPLQTVIKGALFRRRSSFLLQALPLNSADIWKRTGSEGEQWGQAGLPGCKHRAHFYLGKGMWWPGRWMWGRSS